MPDRRQFVQTLLLAQVSARQGTGWQQTMNNRYSFLGGPRGDWKVMEMKTVRGGALPRVDRIEIVNREVATLPPQTLWVLRGFTSNVRYATATEVAALRAKQQGLGRPEATCAALIPIKKSDAWWNLSQDQRRAVFEETSHHTAIGLDYLPAVARRLHHSRDLGEPFDFLTWFEFAPEHRDAFDKMLVRLRDTEEWSFVEREVDIRLERIAAK